MAFGSAHELADQLLGVQFEVRVKHNVSKGVTYANISAYRPLAYGGQDTDLFAPEDIAVGEAAVAASIEPDEIPF